MIRHLDRLLRNLLIGRVDGITAEAQIGFGFPDDAWHTEVRNLGEMALNVYLLDLRENRRLRSNARSQEYNDGLVISKPAPARMDCHYLITAWSPTKPAAGLEPVLDEHSLLYNLAAVLMKNAPINPERIYPPGSAALNTVPELIRHSDLPTQVLPEDGFSKQAEFWGTMGVNHRWKPAIHLVVTIPVELPVIDDGPMVTTLITRYQQWGVPETVETFFQIGGHVLDRRGAEPVAVPQAHVLLQTLDGGNLQKAVTDGRGRFQFIQLNAGEYRLIWWSESLPNPGPPRTILVPAPTGSYDLVLE